MFRSPMRRASSSSSLFCCRPAEASTSKASMTDQLRSARRSVAVCPLAGDVRADPEQPGSLADAAQPVERRSLGDERVGEQLRQVAVLGDLEDGVQLLDRQSAYCPRK